MAEWFKTWFDTSYYHLLYSSRDNEEARHFVGALLSYLAPAPEDRFIDVACGKGRHAICVHQNGYSVVGIDLSQNSIEEARQKEEDGLSFFVHDVRHPFQFGKFHFALNLFTSFGYFSTREEHIEVLKNIRDSLHPGGKLVLDFFHLGYVQSHLTTEERTVVDGVEFSIHRKISNGFVEKYIDVKDGAEEHRFRERVMAFTKEDLCEILEAIDMNVVDVFGDYSMKPFAADAPRVIIIAST